MTNEIFTICLRRNNGELSVCYDGAQQMIVCADLDAAKVQADVLARENAKLNFAVMNNSSSVYEVGSGFKWLTSHAARRAEIDFMMNGW